LHFLKWHFALCTFKMALCTLHFAVWQAMQATKSQLSNPTNLNNIPS
jgi:hypothetical protein